ncbi:uncharacterized protein BO88DRAFT_29932 [Aspergillus vadensis CBS 113365]|uniref:Secreted protein n=1 Tax=Aspergillus vadensis (strain CBS 113365 / IMI 142717 / IBT 24658) TaxID=1448311 RepID=A0A319BRI8_ASPVC|nr:hypothetical protein BO88DRAFT_29932 [Aspergillus vadensis CBS 113365]PYH75021.1 hypothetical protein BO88DRAFT_29932 [Aspergillus vadensis CBS 113365]
MQFLPRLLFYCLCQGYHALDFPAPFDSSGCIKGLYPLSILIVGSSIHIMSIHTTLDPVVWCHVIQGRGCRDSRSRYICEPKVVQFSCQF